MDTDSYCGIALDVMWSVVAEMVYVGNVMKYTVSDEQIFVVRNSKQKTDDKNNDNSKKKTRL